MSEIPEDIDAIATDIVRKPLNPEGEEDFELYLRIAHAILAERQRCAEIAEVIADRSIEDEFDIGYESGALHVARCIRSPK